jgi:beta-lactamase class A
MRIALFVVAAALAVGCSAQAPTPGAPATTAPTLRATSLQALVDAELPAIPARSGIWVKHLPSGEEAAVRADEVFNSASVIKIPVAVQALEMAAAKRLDLAKRLTLTAADVRGGSGVFRYHDAGLQPTFRDVLLQMIITSDNTATDLAIAQVGGVASVNAWLAKAGYADGMKLTQTTGELFAKYNALTPADDRNGKTNADRGFWLGEVTPRATGKMIEAIERRALPSKEGAEELLRMMRAQQAGARRLPHFLTGIQVAHKTGDFPPVLANDVGVVYAPSGAIVVSFFLNEITGNYGKAEDHMGRVTQRIVEYFAR